MRISAAAALACALPLLGCAHRATAPGAELLVTGSGDECRFEADGAVLASGTPGEVEAKLPEALRGLRGREVLVIGGMDAPYKCFGFAIYTLQRIEHRRFGFAAEPPPERE